MVRTKLSFLTAAFVGVITFSSLVLIAEAQTNRRRSTTKTNPVATPTPSRGEPAVISRADDYPTVVIEPVPADGTQPKTDPANNPTGGSDSIEELRERLLKLETRKKDPDEKQRRLSLNLDILTKAEQRSDGLRKQLFEMIEKESNIRTRMDQIDNDIRPEALERSLATVGSLRPEELRAQKRRSLELEKQNLQNLLTEVQKNRANIELNLGRSDQLVERLRTKIEKEIDSALGDEEVPDKKPIE